MLQRISPTTVGDQITGGWQGGDLKTRQEAEAGLQVRGSFGLGGGRGEGEKRVNWG